MGDYEGIFREDAELSAPPVHDINRKLEARRHAKRLGNSGASMGLIHAEADALFVSMSSTLLRRRFLAGLPALGLVPGAVAAQADDPLRHIVFGSCLDTHDHPMLDRALTLPRDLFIFMGDNIY